MRKSGEFSIKKDNNNHHILNSYKKAYEQLMLEPNYSEIVFRELILLLKLQENNVSEFEANGENVKINAKTLKEKFELLLKLLNRERNNTALEAVKKIQNLKKSLSKFERLFEKHICPFDIAEIQSTYQERANEALDLNGIDLILLAGETGVGKSTAIHYLDGSTFEYQNGRLRTTRYREEVKDFEIGESVESKTQQVCLVKLNQEKFHLKSKKYDNVYLYDTPGFGDTAGKERTVINSMLIANPLRNASSIRILVLISPRSYGNRADGLIRVLESVANMVPDVKQYASSIYYAISGSPDELSRERILGDINEFLDSNNSNVKLTDEVRYILQNIKERFSGKKVKIKYIQPAKKKHIGTSPQKELVESIIKHCEPIKNPEDAIKPFVEEQYKEALNRQIQIHSKMIESTLARMKQNFINDPSDKNIYGDYFLLKKKISELHYIKESLPSDATDSMISDCFKRVLEIQNKNRISVVNFLQSPQIDFINEDQAKKLYAAYLFDNFIEPIISNFLGNLANNNGGNEEAPKEMLEEVDAYIKRLTNDLVRQAEEQINEFVPNGMNEDKNRITTFNLLVANIRVLKNYLANEIKIFNNDFKNEDNFSEITTFIEKSKTILIDCFNAANIQNDFIAMAAIINRMKEIVNLKAVDGIVESEIQNLIIEIENLKTKFDQNLKAITPSIPELLEANPNKRLSANNVGQIEKSLKILGACYLDHNVSEHFQDQDGNNTISTSISFTILKEISEYYKSVKGQIVEIMADKNNINGIANLIPLMQQVQFIRSLPIFPDENATKFEKDYIEQIENPVKLYAVNFSTKLSEKLTIEKVVFQTYDDITTYIKSINLANWIKDFKLENDTKGELISAVETRANQLIESANNIALDYINHSNISENKWIVDEITYMLESVGGFLNEEACESLEAAKANFEKRITQTLQNINLTIQNHNFESLDIAYFTTITSYISTCEQQAILPEDATATKNIVLEFLKDYTDEKRKQIDSEFAAILPKQEENEYLLLDPSELTEKVKSVESILNEFSQLEQQLNGSYPDWQSPYQDWCAQLTEYLQTFRKQMQQSFEQHASNQARLSNKQSNFVLLINAAKTFEPLDPFLLETEESLSFKKLHDNYDATLRSEHYETVSSALNCVFIGNYEEAASAANSIDPISSLADTFKSQVNAHVTNLSDEVADNLKKIEKSDSMQPENLVVLEEQLIKLQNAEALINANYISEDRKSKRHDILDNAQSSIDVWFNHSINTINQNIALFKLKDATKALSQLTQTVNQMKSQPPREAINILNRTTDTLVNKINAVIAQFNQSINQWNNNDFALEKVRTELKALENLPWNQISFAQVWKDLSGFVIDQIKIECSDLAKEFQEGTLNINSVFDRINIMINLLGDSLVYPKDFLGFIKTKLKQTLTAIQVYVINSDDLTFKDKLDKISVIVNDNSKLLRKFVGEYDLSTVTQFLRQQSEDILAIASGLLKKNVFPADEIQQLIVIYEKLNDHFPFLQTDYYDVCQQRFSKLCDGTFNNLTENLTKFMSGHKKVEDVCSDLADSMEFLTSINRYLKTVNSDHAKKLIPEYFHERVSDFLNIFVNILNDNAKAFERALENHDLNGLKLSLNFAENWNEVFNSVSVYISTCADNKQDNVMLEITNHINHYNVNALAELIMNRLGIIRKRFDDRTVDFLLSQPENSEDKRRDHYQNLIDDLRFINNLSGLNDFLDLDRSQNNIPRDYFFKECIDKLTTYLQHIYNEACNELTSNFDKNKNWGAFDRLYKELMVFSTKCKEHADLNTIKLKHKFKNDEEDQQNILMKGFNSIFSLDSSPFFAVNAGNVIKDVFKKFLEEEKSKFLNVKVEQFQNSVYREQLIEFLLGLQQFINEVPTLSDFVRMQLTQVLTKLKDKFGAPSFQYIAEQLQADDSGLGASIINEQKCFKGLANELRNTKTQAHGLDYILENLANEQGKGGLEKIDAQTSNQLRNAYETFESKYNELLAQYLDPSLDFGNNSDKYLADMFAELNELLDNNKVQQKDGKVIWNSNATEKVPELTAYLFAIWTLRDSQAYFNAAKENDANVNYLKKPHAAQILAVFMMLNITNSDEDLKNHLVQVLTGEGKSVIMAATASILALLGFKVNCACYSEYLSERDFNDFKDIFEFLKIEKYISYGTFNQLFERVLNENGDLRDRVKHIITGSADDRDIIDQNIKRERDEIILVDEVDVFFNRDFYGSLYQPFFMLQGDEENDLIDAIWMRHKQGLPLSVQVIKQSKEFQACLKKYPQCEYLLISAVDRMLADLERYTKNDGHDYVVKEGDIVYEYQDGTSSKLTKGYQTLWAAYHEFENVHRKVSQQARNNHRGIIINCGAFSYAEMLRNLGRFKCILGVSGTLKELSVPEAKIIHDEFSIKEKTYLPSAYGKNKLQFNKQNNVRVEDEDDYYNELVTEINRRSLGDGPSRRPVIVFFEDKKSMKHFYKSSKMAGLRNQVQMIHKSSSSTVAEREAEIRRATQANSITFALEEFGRGIDFKVSSQKVEANGGPHVIYTKLAKELSKERQIQGRTARAGGQGSFSMVLKLPDLQNEYNLSADQIDKMAAVYEELNAIRVNKFATEYEDLTNKLSVVCKEFHDPSMKLWEYLNNFRPGDDIRPLLELLKTFNPAVSTGKKQFKKSRVEVLIDATGSMGGVIEVVKAVMSLVMTNLAATLEEFDIEAGYFAIQMAVYRNYCSGPDILEHSKWSYKPNDLQNFINKIQSKGGDGNEAVEIALRHAKREAKKEVNGEQGVSQVILIGDAAPNIKEEVESKRGNKIFLNKHLTTSDIQTAKLKKKNIPINTFFVRTGGDGKEKEAKNAFSKISDETGGTCEKLDVSNKEAAAKQIYDMFKIVFEDVAGEDEKLKADMLEHYGKSFLQ